METFKNPIFHNLNSKVKEYQFNLMNSKVSNQEVFFNIPEHDLSSSKTTKKVIFLNSFFRDFSNQTTNEVFHGTMGYLKLTKKKL